MSPLTKWVARLSLGSLTVMMLWGSVRAFGTEREFASQGKTARVESIEDAEVRTSRGRRRSSTTVYAMVHFTTNSGEPRAVRTSIPERVIEAANKGGVIEIEYLPGKPDQIRFPGGFPESLGMLGLALALGGILFFIERSEKKASL